MWPYFIKRLLLFIPTLIGISILFFFLSKLSPGDPVLNRLEGSLHNSSGSNLQTELSIINELSEDLGLNKPLFYFSIHRKTVTDTAFRIAHSGLRKNLQELAFQAASWELTHDFYREWKLAIHQVQNANEEAFLNRLIQVKSLKDLESQQNLIESNPKWSALSSASKHLIKGESHWNNYLPVFSWYGLNNQYHTWITNLIQGNFGKSLSDGGSVKNKIAVALGNTLLISIISITLAFLMAIPLAVRASSLENRYFDKIISTLLFSLYALPTFWVATLLIIYFGGGDYLNWFPAYGLGEVNASHTIFEAFKIRTAHLILPVFCLTYGTLAFLFKQVRNSMKSQLKSDYILTAYSKGISKKKVLYEHAFKNASFPLITILGKTFPAVVSGAFVVEFIFSINGMGKLAIDSFLSRDFPVIFAILLVISFFTLLGSWIADVTYHIVDPRVKLSNQKSLN